MTPNSNGCSEGGVSPGSGSGVIVGDVMHHGGDMHGSMQNGGAKGGCDGNDAHLKKGPWTAEEDAILVEYVRKHGEGNWNAVQRHSGLARCGKSCRLRWANHLRPNLKKGAFSPEEKRLIVELHAKFGNKWARMASLLPGRTDNEIKNYWNTRVKRHQREGLPLYPPDIQPQHPPSPHFHHHHHPKSPWMSTKNSTTPTSSFTFQTHFNSQSNPHTPTSATPPPLSPTTTSTSFPTLPVFDYSQAHNHLHSHHLHSHHQHPHSHHTSHSTPTTPTSSFSFQTQLHSPTAHSHTAASTPPPLSPLSSPSTNPNNLSFPTLPLFDFNVPRTPPILQAPLRFKRFSSNHDISNTVPTNPQSNNPPHFSLLSSPYPPSSSSSMGQRMPSCFANFTNNSNNHPDFHSELQKENQEMCSLLASVSHPELPSNQFSSSFNQNRNLGIGVAGSKYGRRMTKKKFGNSMKDKMNGNLGFALEYLLQEAETFTDYGQASTDQNNLVLKDQKPKMLVSQGFSTHWDESNSVGISSGMNQKVEGEGQQLNGMQEDLSRVLNNLPSMKAELYSDSADISNGQSSVVTDDNIGFEMQQIASLFPPQEHDRNIGSCSWDNLPGIC